MTNQLPPGGPPNGLYQGGVATTPRRLGAPPADGSAENGQQGVQITPAFVLRAMRRWWKIALPIAIVMAIAGGTWMWVVFEPKYHSTAWLRIEDKKPYVAYKIVSTAHRQSAFEAAKWLIDSLKESVPIWKKENFADGTTEWVHPGVSTESPASKDP